MNRTLIELTRAMLTKRQMPEFLWELAVAHATYLHNRSYSHALLDSTLYQRWHGSKLDVRHLREFRSPIYILSKGPSVPRKMLPKSNERLLVGYNDGACAVKYYHRETCKILTSRNYQFMENNYKLPPVPDQGSHIKIECDNKPIQSTKGVPRPSVRSEELL